MVARRAAPEPGLAAKWAASTLFIQLRKVREERGITHAQVAERMGLSQPHVARLEKRPLAARLAKVMAYAEALGVELVLTEREVVAA